MMYDGIAYCIARLESGHYSEQLIADDVWDGHLRRVYRSANRALPDLGRCCGKDNMMPEA